MTFKKNQLVNGRYFILKKIGQGSFGTVYQVQDQMGKRFCAMKAQKRKRDGNQLKHELFIAKEMSCEGFIEAIDYGEMPGKPGIDYLITQLLGPSLQTVLTLCESKFSLHCACLVTMQMLNVMESMHNKGYIHRDLKPDNYMFGLRHETQKLFLIDYGLVKKILNPKNGKHIPFETNK